MKTLAQNRLIWASLYVIALLVSTMPTTPTALAQDESAEAQGEATESAPPESNTSNSGTAESKPASPAEGAAESKPASSSEGATNAPAAPSQSAVINPWVLNTDPIFKGPPVKKFLTPADLTGRDRQILENLDYKPAGTKLRLEQIKKITGELSKAPYVLMRPSIRHSAFYVYMKSREWSLSGCVLWAAQTPSIQISIKH